jgi:hypothetical protein
MRISTCTSCGYPSSWVRRANRFLSVALVAVFLAVVYLTRPAGTPGVLVASLVPVAVLSHYRRDWRPVLVWIGYIVGLAAAPHPIHIQPRR